jgi:oxygen-independent coproporphyrinogen-3 oxidase
VTDSLGIYVHVPFCRTRCRYCDFFRVGENRAKQTEFLAALARQIAAAPLAGRPVETVFLGGGTPSLLSPVEVGGVLAQLRRRYAIDPAAEISLEANPSDLRPEILQELRAVGVNRLSLGVQSFVDHELSLLGRRHGAAGAADCVRWAKAAGFDSVSVDLMLAIPAQTDARFRATLKQTLELEPHHVSLYILEVHERSEMDFLRRERPGLFAGEEAQRRRYLSACATLREAGYEHYEISNFARPGFRSRHNLRYWQCRPVIGFGPSAHSFDGERRWRCPADLPAYLADPTRQEPVTTELALEAAFLGLRLREGISLEVLLRATGAAAGSGGATPGQVEIERRLQRVRPFAEQCGDRIRLTEEGFVLSTPVIARLLDDAAPSSWAWEAGS